MGGRSRAGPVLPPGSGDLAPWTYSGACSAVDGSAFSSCFRGGIWWGRHSCLPRGDVLVDPKHPGRMPEYRHPRQTRMQECLPHQMPSLYWKPFRSRRDPCLRGAGRSRAMKSSRGLALPGPTEPREFRDHREQRPAYSRGKLARDNFQRQHFSPIFFASHGEHPNLRAWTTTARRCVRTRRGCGRGTAIADLPVFLPRSDGDR